MEDEGGHHEACSFAQADRSCLRASVRISSRVIRLYQYGLLSVLKFTQVMSIMILKLLREVWRGLARLLAYPQLAAVLTPGRAMKARLVGHLIAVDEKRRRDVTETAIWG